MANNNENKILNVPNLRFPEFTGEWKQSLLKEYLVENKERNTKGVFSKAEVLSVSGDKGIVNQIELLGRSYAGQSVLPYHIVRRNNIVYTKSPLSEFPYGIVKMNRGNDGIVSTLYAVYSVQETAYPSFIEYYFASKDRTNRYFKPIVRIGAKHDMKIGNGEVLANMVRFPSIKEQRRISEFLELIDKRIATQNKIIEDLKKLKSAIIDYIFSNEAQSYRKRVLLSDVATKITRKNTNNQISNVLSNSANQGIIPQNEVFDREIANEDNTSNYFVISQNDFVYNPRKSITAPYGPINRYHGETDGVISPLYLCFRSHSIDVEYLRWYFQSDSWHKYVYQNGDTGVRHDRVSIKDETFFSMPLYIHSAEEQMEIAERLNKIESLVSIEEQFLFRLKSQKQYLLHQMFI